jgi:predicted PurR-regulated permease PerM
MGGNEQPGDERDKRQLSLRLLVIALCLASVVALIPFWAPLVLAAWAAVVAAPLHRWVVKRIHRRKGAAALVTVLRIRR